MIYICLGYLESGKSKTCQRAEHYRGYSSNNYRTSHNTHCYGMRVYKVTASRCNC